MLLLLLITFLAFLLRIVLLGEVPVGFHRDEAFFGYNAYSIFLTSRDMTGSLLPLHLASFLYSPAGYAYFVIPFIALFGLTEFAVRLPSALFGTATVVVTYFLVKALLISENSENRKNQKTSFDFLMYLKNLKHWRFEFSEYSGKIALISAFLLAISPWHINLSRTATENVIVVFFIALGVLLYLLWIKKEFFLFLLLSFFFFYLTLFVYHAPRSFLPLFLPLLFFCFPHRVWKTKILPLFGLFFAAIVLPVLMVITSPDLSERFRMLSLFHTPETQLVLDEQLREDGLAEIPPVIARIFHNKVINYSETFLTTYFSHFSYAFLFTDAGFPDRYRVPGMGLLYLWDLPLIIIGTTILLRRNRRLGIFLLGWVLLAPVGSGLTYDDVPNLQRTLLVFPVLSFLSAVGAVTLWDKTKKTRFVWVIRIVILLILFYGIGYYLHQYYIHQVHHRPWHRQEGYKELVTRINQLLPDYSHAVINDHETEPIIFFLFYSHYDPEKIQQKLDGYKGGKFPSFEKYIFTHDQCPLRTGSIASSSTTKVPHIIGKKGVLYVNHGPCKIKDKRIETIAEITRTDGTPVFWIQKLK